jgi:uncharacterized protein
MTDSLVANPRAIHEIEHCWIPLPDGTRLAAKIWLPIDAEEEPVPAILEYLPYRKRDGTRGRDRTNHPPVAEAGYACIRVDIRGTGDSEGVYHDEYTVQEQLDGCDVIAWIAEQPWCTGAVGIIGISWGGFNGLQIAARRPPALKAIITIGSTDDRYATDVHYYGGCLIKDNIGWGGVMFGINALPPDPELVGEDWRDMWMARLEADTPWTLEWLRHQRRDAYWQQGSVNQDFSKIACAVYAVSGWADNYNEAVPRLLAGLSCPRKGLSGPWAHQYPNKGHPGPAIDFLGETVRWWDHWLKGIDTGIMDEPMYRAWIQDSAPPATVYPERPGRWVGEPSWPSPNIETRVFAMNPGRLDEKPGDETPLVLCSLQATGTHQAMLCHHGEPGTFSSDQRGDDAASLVFVSEPLAEPAEILGAPIVELTLASDRPNAFVAVRLNDVAPSGASTRVHHGVLNLNRRRGMDRSDPLVPGEPVTVRVEIDDIGHAFPAGHRIAVSVSSTYFPLVWPSPKAVTLTLLAGRCHLELPVRRPDAPDGTFAPFGAPVNGPGSAMTPVAKGQGLRREVLRDIASSTTMTHQVQDSGLNRHDDTGEIEGERGENWHSIVEGDPATARSRTERVDTWQKDGIAIEIRTRQELWADAADFHFSAELEAFENGASVFSRSWSETVPRDGN